MPPSLLVVFGSTKGAAIGSLQLQCPPSSTRPACTRQALLPVRRPHVPGRFGSNPSLRSNRSLSDYLQREFAQRLVAQPGDAIDFSLGATASGAAESEAAPSAPPASTGPRKKVRFCFKELNEFFFWCFSVYLL